MKRYCITDSLAVAARAAQDGVDMIQIRAKDLSTRRLSDLVRAAIASLANAHASPIPLPTVIPSRDRKEAVVEPTTKPHPKILVNTHTDIALACGADGVHVPARSISPATIRQIVPAGFLIAVSCHTIAELQAAQSEGADFAVFGPIFPSVTKSSNPIGLEALRQAAASVNLPIYALGGITKENAALCIQTGATGIAGISLFT